MQLSWTTCIILFLAISSSIDVDSISSANSSSSSTKILLVGDSNAEFMGQTLETFCADSHVTNAGIGGTTAEEWASYALEDIPVECGASDLWDVVYISLGGNDMLESGCSLTANELLPIMERAIENIVTQLVPGASRYILTGYCMPFSSEEETGSESGCGDPANYIALSDAVKTLSANNVGIASGSSLEVIDSISVCGGSSTSFSNGEFFQDPIHLNAKGYCKVFSQSAVQSAMLCDTSSGTFDCDSLTGDEIYGLDENCISGDSPSSGSYKVTTVSADKPTIFAFSIVYLYVSIMM